MKTFKEYLELYLLTDVLLLNDVCQRYVSCMMTVYDLYPFHFISAPSFSLRAALKMTKACIQLLTDVDMYNVVKRGIRGGISQISQRYAEANNKEMGDCFDQSKPSNYILYMDANNLYGYAMMDYLPLGGYKWVEAKLYKTTKKHGYIYIID